MEKDEVLEMIRNEIREGLKVVIDYGYDSERTVKLVFNGEVISSDFFNLPSEG